MTGPSSTPRGEHTPRPGATWETAVVITETFVHDDDALAQLATRPATPGVTWISTTDDPAPYDQPGPPRPNRATRRALARARKARR